MYRKKKLLDTIVTIIIKSYWIILELKKSGLFVKYKGNIINWDKNKNGKVYQESSDFGQSTILFSMMSMWVGTRKQLKEK